MLPTYILIITLATGQVAQFDTSSFTGKPLTKNTCVLEASFAINYSEEIVKAECQLNGDAI